MSSGESYKAVRRLHFYSFYDEFLWIHKWNFNLSLILYIVWPDWCICNQTIVYDLVAVNATGANISVHQVASSAIHQLLLKTYWESWRTQSRRVWWLGVWWWEYFPAWRLGECTAGAEKSTTQKHVDSKEGPCEKQLKGQGRQGFLDLMPPC